MVQAADAWKCDNLAGAGRLERARDRRIAAKRHVRSVPVVVLDVLADQTEQMPLAEHDDVVEQFAPQRATHRSANPFCHGERAAVRNCRTPRFSTRASNAPPKIASRSRTKRTGTTSEPMASTICCAAQAAKGCAVTLT